MLAQKMHQPGTSVVQDDVSIGTARTRLNWKTATFGSSIIEELFCDCTQSRPKAAASEAILSVVEHFDEEPLQDASPELLNQVCSGAGKSCDLTI